MCRSANGGPERVNSESLPTSREVLDHTSRPFYGIFVGMSENTANIHSLAPFSEVAPRVIETERLRLRAATTEDLVLLFETYSGDVVATRYMAWPRVATPEAGRPFVELVEASFSGAPLGLAQFAWLIQLKGTEEFIGGCGIGARSETSAEGGYILNPKFWSKGYATEAFKPVVAWAQTQPHVQRIVATHHPDNPASGAVMRKAGLDFSAINRMENAYPNSGDVVVDQVEYAWERS